MEVIKSIFSELGINKTFFYQFILVVLAYIFLARGVFKPLLEILLLRKEKTLGKRKLADNVLHEFKEAHEEYDRQWKGYERKAFIQRADRHEEVRLRANAIIERAQKEARDFLIRRRIVIEDSFSSIRKELDKDIPEFTKDIRDRLIVREEL